MTTKFQCVMCQYVREEEDKAASIAISPTLDWHVCKICARLMLAAMKEIKKSE